MLFHKRYRAPYFCTLLLILLVIVWGCATTPSPAPASPPAPAKEEVPQVKVSAPTIEQEVKPVGTHKVVSTVRGCLGRANLGQDPEVRLPPERGDDEPIPELLAEAYDWGLVVRHKLRHPCCLKGAVDAEIEGGLVVVTQKFSGTPCNCYCWSTIFTRVGLPPGDYDLLVEQVGPAMEQTLLFTTLEVGAQ
jgi:hypothetical protein